LGSTYRSPSKTHRPFFSFQVPTYEDFEAMALQLLALLETVTAPVERPIVVD
jgi:hypothetical protein